MDRWEALQHRYEDIAKARHVAGISALAKPIIAWISVKKMRDNEPQVESSDEPLTIFASENPDDYEPALDRRERKASDKPLLHFTVPPCWRFHKSDPDPWPSLLHGHHNQEPWKLNAIDGLIYHNPTRVKVRSLKRKELARIQTALLTSKDFGEKAQALIKRAA